MEVNLAAANSMLSFVLKCENPKLAPSFMQHFFGALVCSDMEGSSLDISTSIVLHATGVSKTNSKFYYPLIITIIIL